MDKRPVPHNYPIPQNMFMVLQRMDKQKWGFDIFELEKLAKENTLKITAFEIFNVMRFIDNLRLDPQRVENFLNEIERKCIRITDMHSSYPGESNPYHNNVHAADVAYCAYYLLRSSFIEQWLSSMEQFALIIAAIIHVYDYPGMTEDALEKLSQRSNATDEPSFLKKISLDAAMSLIETNECNITAGMKKEDREKFLSLVTDLVMAIDNHRHSANLKELTSFLAAHEKKDLPENHLSTMKWILYCADLNYLAKDWPLALCWAKRKMKENYFIGDLEKRKGRICSAHCDRDNPEDKIAPVQIKFARNVVMPTFDALGELLGRYHKSTNMARRYDKPWKTNIPNNIKKFEEAIRDNRDLMAD